MVQSKSAIVPFQKSLVSKCLCPVCPVQKTSQCVSGKLKTLKEALKTEPLKKEDIPGVYCATGKATCADLDAKKSCLCGGCPVFSRYKLDSYQPVGGYCQGGAAG